MTWPRFDTCKQSDSTVQVLTLCTSITITYNTEATVGICKTQNSHQQMNGDRNTVQHCHLLDSWQVNVRASVSSAACSESIMDVLSALTDSLQVSDLSVCSLAATSTVAVVTTVITRVCSHSHTSCFSFTKAFSLRHLCLFAYVWYDAFRSPRRN